MVPVEVIVPPTTRLFVHPKLFPAVTLPVALNVAGLIKLHVISPVVVIFVEPKLPLQFNVFPLKLKPVPALIVSCLLLSNKSISSLTFFNTDGLPAVSAYFKALTKVVSPVKLLALVPVWLILPV